MKLRQTAIAAARAGGSIVRKYYESGVEMRQKSSYNLVCDADLEAEAAIISHIKSVYPDHCFYAEETQKDTRTSEHLWVIDPLDGTNNFAHKIPQFACALAYYHNGTAQIGVVFNPVRDECFLSVRGEGAYLNGEKISVSSVNSLDSAIIGTGFYYDRGAMMEATLAAIKTLFEKRIHGIRRFGAASLDLCYVGCGYFDSFFEYTLAPWDYAAGRLFVIEAGGMVTDHLGRELFLDKKQRISQ